MIYLAYVIPIALSLIQCRTRRVIGEVREERSWMLSPQNASFDSKKSRILGQVMSKEEIFVDLSKVETISQWKQPRNFTEVRSFLG